MLEVDVDNGSPGKTQANGNVSINTQRAQTRVLVQNGATTVIGGIYACARSATRTGRRVSARSRSCAGSSRGPITDNNEELLIFITPRVIRLK